MRHLDRTPRRPRLRPGHFTAGLIGAWLFLGTQLLVAWERTPDGRHFLWMGLAALIALRLTTRTTATRTNKENRA